MKKFCAPIALLSILFLSSSGFAADQKAAERLPDERREFTSSALLADGTILEITIIDFASHEERALGGIQRAAIAVRQLEEQFIGENNFAKRLESARPRTPVGLSREAFEIMKRARNLSVLTDGWFDVTTPSAHSAFVKRDYRRLILDDGERTIAFKSRNMKLDLTWLFRAAAVDAALESLVSNGYADAKVEAGQISRHIGRDIYTPWAITFELPQASPSNAHRALRYNLSNIATATLYPASEVPPLIDPKKREPIQPFLTRATALANDAVTAVAFALAVAPLEPLTAIRAFDKYPEVEGMIVGADGSFFISEGLLSATSSTGDELRDDRVHPDRGSEDLKRKRQEEESDVR